LASKVYDWVILMRNKERASLQEREARLYSSCNRTQLITLHITPLP